MYLVVTYNSKGNAYLQTRGIYDFAQVRPLNKTLQVIAKRKTYSNYSLLMNR